MDFSDSYTHICNNFKIYITYRVLVNLEHNINIRLDIMYKIFIIVMCFNDLQLIKAIYVIKLLFCYDILG
jgi:hypothetical protein